MWSYLEMGLPKGNQVKMRSLGWVLMQYDWCPCKRGALDTETFIQGRQCEDTRRIPPPGQGMPEATRSQERGTTDSPSQPSERTNPAHTRQHPNISSHFTVWHYRSSLVWPHPLYLTLIPRTSLPRLTGQSLLQSKVSPC